MDLEFLINMKEKIDNMWNCLPKVVQDGKYSCPEIQNFNEYKNMFLGMGRMYYNDPTLRYEDLQERLDEEIKEQKTYKSK